MAAISLVYLLGGAIAVIAVVAITVAIIKSHTN